MRASSASMASTGDSARVANACDSAATPAQTGSSVVMSGSPFLLIAETPRGVPGDAALDGELRTEPDVLGQARHLERRAQAAAAQVRVRRPVRHDAHLDAWPRPADVVHDAAHGDVLAEAEVVHGVAEL